MKETLLRQKWQNKRYRSSSDRERRNGGQTSGREEGPAERRKEGRAKEEEDEEDAGRDEFGRAIPLAALSQRDRRGREGEDGIEGGRTEGESSRDRDAWRDWGKMEDLGRNGNRDDHYESRRRDDGRERRDKEDTDGHEKGGREDYNSNSRERRDRDTKRDDKYKRRSPPHLKDSDSRDDAHRYYENDDYSGDSERGRRQSDTHQDHDRYGDKNDDNDDGGYTDRRPLDRHGHYGERESRRDSERWQPNITENGEDRWRVPFGTSDMNEGGPSRSRRYSPGGDWRHTLQRDADFRGGVDGPTPPPFEVGDVVTGVISR